MDHGHLRRLPSLLLLRKDIHSPLLPSSVSTASEATIHDLRPPGLLHHLLLGRLLYRHRSLQRPEPTVGHHGDDELFCLRGAYFRNRRPGSCCRRHHTRFPSADGAEATHLVAAEDILALRLLGRVDVSLSNAQRKTPKL